MEHVGGDKSQCVPFKVVLLGESAVGKSSLVLRFCKGEFYDNMESTIGAAFLTKIVDIPNQGQVKLEIWDTAGQERYKSLAPMYYRGASGSVVVYDICSYNSYVRSKQWVKELKRQGTPGMEIVLVGNKCDLEDRRNVDKAEAEAYAEDSGILFYETSAKNNVNVRKVFQRISKELKTKLDENPPKEEEVGEKFWCTDGKCGSCPRCFNKTKEGDHLTENIYKTFTNK